MTSSGISRGDEVAARHPRLPVVHHRRREAAGTFVAAVREPTNDVYLSVASIWEAVIKHGLGKLPLPAPPAEYLPGQRDAHGIATLPIDEGAMLDDAPSSHHHPPHQFSIILRRGRKDFRSDLAVFDEVVQQRILVLVQPEDGRHAVTEAMIAAIEIEDHRRTVREHAQPPRAGDRAGPTSRATRMFRQPRS
jgi:PIN domain nuclease of toxin-antitoxin system